MSPWATWVLNTASLPVCDSTRLIIHVGWSVGTGAGSDWSDLSLNMERGLLCGLVDLFFLWAPGSLVLRSLELLLQGAQFP